jgi:hypothetical protein
VNTKREEEEMEMLAKVHKSNKDKEEQVRIKREHEEDAGSNLHHVGLIFPSSTIIKESGGSFEYLNQG